MLSEEETNEALIARYKFVKDKYDKASEASRRFIEKHGYCNGEKSRWAGCLGFNLSGIRDKIEERGLQVPS